MVISKYLDPKNDIAFKRIFGTEKNKDILITLLNEVLKNQLESAIEDVQFLNPSQDPEIVAKKQSIVDVLCRDQNKNAYIIEMQAAGFEERAQYYAYKTFVSQMHKGGKYEGLKEVIFLAFTNFPIFPKKKAYKSEHVTLDKNTLERDLNKVSFTFVDLVKFAKTCKKQLEELTLEEKFYYFLSHGEETKAAELKALIKSSPIIARAYNELKRYNWSEEELLRYEKEEKRVRDNQAVLDHAINFGIAKGKKEGIQEGIKEGMEKGKKEGIQEGIKEGTEKGKKEGIQQEKIAIAKNMLNNGLDIKLIQEVTKLSKQTIESLISK